jgi:S1-C subfamily serine protease
VVVGTPGGNAGCTTAGAVMQVGRSHTVTGGPRLHDVIEVDALVRKGNSGGGIFNARGELIAIAAAGSRDGGLGVGVRVVHVERLASMARASDRPQDQTESDLAAQSRTLFVAAMQEDGDYGA